MEKKVDIYYDGECGVCTRIMHRIQASSRGETFAFHDVRTGDIPSGLTQEISIRYVHAIESGSLYKGGDVILAVMRQYPAWRWLANVLSLWPFVWFVQLAYVVLARNRRFFKHFI